MHCRQKKKPDISSNASALLNNEREFGFIVKEINCVLNEYMHMYDCTYVLVKHLARLVLDDFNK